MAVQLERRLFTLDEYERMIDAGVFGEDERIELVRGEIVGMTPIGFDHAGCVARLTMLLARMAGDSAVVWVQNPIQVAPNSRLEPDVALLKPQDYRARRPATPSDVMLMIEVADTSVQRDRAVKGPLYAEAGIPEYWIVNLQDSAIEVYSNPIEGTYKQTRKAKRGDTLPLPADLGGAVQVSEILGN